MPARAVPGEPPGPPGRGGGAHAPADLESAAASSATRDRLLDGVACLGTGETRRQLHPWIALGARNRDERAAAYRRECSACSRHLGMPEGRPGGFHFTPDEQWLRAEHKPRRATPTSL